MIQVKKLYEKGRYDFRDKECIGKKCFCPGEYFTRGACGGGGSRSTGASKLCCTRRAYHGCPTDEQFDPAIAKGNKAKGWKTC